jgi:hypothetical protein
MNPLFFRLKIKENEEEKCFWTFFCRQERKPVYFTKKTFILHKYLKLFHFKKTRNAFVLTFLALRLPASTLAILFGQVQCVWIVLLPLNIAKSSLRVVHLQIVLSLRGNQERVQWFEVHCICQMKKKHFFYNYRDSS